MTVREDALACLEKLHAVPPILTWPVSEMGDVLAWALVTTAIQAETLQPLVLENPSMRLAIEALHEAMREFQITVVKLCLD